MTRFIIMHKTNAHWESGARPTPELVARVGSLLQGLAARGMLLAGEGLRPSSEGVRLTFSGSERAVTKGPFGGGQELPAGFSIVRAASLDEAIEFASSEAAILGDVEIDIRPVTEPWDIGIAAAPPELRTRRYMVLRKATAATEADEAPTPAQRTELAHLRELAARDGCHLVTETMRPSRRGRRYKNSREGVVCIDGPFTETKELIGGYVVISAPSITEAGRLAEQYFAVVETGEVDVRELE